MPRSGITVRHARIADAARMTAYMAALLAENLDTISRRAAPTLNEERDFIRNVTARERAFILLALNRDEVVGMLDFHTGQRDHNRHAGGFGMSVAKAWRGRGIGRKLVARAIREAKAWPGFCRIEIECVPWNTAAIRLYESFGFIIEAHKRKALNLRGVPEDDLLMALVW
jgi:putative acetyltransferase